MEWTEVPYGEEIQQWWRPFLPDRVPPALLWIGPEGVGKTAGVWMLTKSLLCPHAEGITACGRCPSCQKVDKLEHPHLFLLIPLPSKVSLEEGVNLFRRQFSENPFLSLIEWESTLPEGKGNLSIGVEAIRRLQDTLTLTVEKNSWRVVWFWHAEHLTRQAANALLKLVEEPPFRTVFFFIATHVEALPVTLRSRCQIWRFPPLPKAKLEMLMGKPLQGATYALSQGSISRLRWIESPMLEGYVKALQSWLRSLLDQNTDPAPAIETLLRAPQLSEIILMGTILVREHRQLSLVQRAIGMETLLRLSEEIEANLQPALLLWEATLFLRRQWREPQIGWEWLFP